MQGKRQTLNSMMMMAVSAIHNATCIYSTILWHPSMKNIYGIIDLLR